MTAARLHDSPGKAASDTPFAGNIVSPGKPYDWNPKRAVALVRARATGCDGRQYRAPGRLHSNVRHVMTIKKSSRRVRIIHFETVAGAANASGRAGSSNAGRMNTAARVMA
jgi:hypothetical protein